MRTGTGAPPFTCPQHAGLPADRTCPACRRTRRVYDRWYDEQVRTVGPRMVDAAPAGARIRDHHAHHWSNGHLAHVFAIKDTTLRDVAAGRQDRITRDYADRIMRRWPTFANAPDDALVPVIPTRRRIEALHALGYTRRQHIDPMVPTNNVSQLLRGDRVHIATHRAIAAGYAALAGTPGPSALTRSRAATAGFLPPAAYDDIDNLYAAPVA